MAELPAVAEPEVWEGEGRAAQPPLAHAAPRLSAEGFEGPLDFLLEMVRRQRVDLGRLSILSLTDYLVAAIEDGGGRIPLERRGDWLVMASQLLLLRAQLLAPTPRGGRGREGGRRAPARAPGRTRPHAGRG